MRRPTQVDTATAALGGKRTFGVATSAVDSCPYTLVLFLASVFAGIAAASRRLLVHSQVVSRMAAITLVVIGIGTFAYGVTLL
jgi:hypothetical protein